MNKGLYRNGWVVEVDGGYWGNSGQTGIYVVKNIEDATMYYTEFVALLWGNPVEAHVTREDMGMPWSKPKLGWQK